MPRPGTITPIVFLLFVITVSKTASIPATASASNEIFTDITEQAGITWQQFGGESPDRFLIETMGGGVAFLDIDNDGTPRHLLRERWRNASWQEPNSTQ